MPDPDTAMPRRSFLRIAGSALAASVAAPAFSQSAAGQHALSAIDFLNSVGVSIHLSQRQTPYFTSFDRVAELIKDIGITHLRDDGIYTNYVNRDYEHYRRIRTLVGCGCRFDIVCADPLNGYVFVPPRRLPDIYDWCDGGVEIFEGANEPNLVKNSGINPAISAEHQRSLYAVVKGNAKLRDLIVAAPSYIQKNVPIAENLSDAVDWINVHPYPGMEHPETSGSGALNGFVAAARHVLGDKPILVSETGYHTAVETNKPHLPVSEEIKTRYFPRMLLFNFLKGARRTYVYELIDSFNNGPADPESNFGLAKFDGTTKPSFAAVKQLLALCTRPSSPAVAQDFRFTVTGNTQDLQTVALKRDDGSHLLFLWLGVSGWDQATRKARPPVTQQLTLGLGLTAQAIRCHQFQDDGLVVVKERKLISGALEVYIRDQLTAIEIGFE